METPFTRPTPLIKSNPPPQGARVNLKTPVNALLLAFFSLSSIQSSQADTSTWTDAVGNTSVAGDILSTGLRFHDTLAIKNSATTRTLALPGALGSLASDITFHGTGAVASGSIVVSRAISTAGYLFKNDAGITTLSGANTYDQF